MLGLLVRYRTPEWSEAEVFQRQQTENTWRSTVGFDPRKMHATWPGRPDKANVSFDVESVAVGPLETGQSKCEGDLKRTLGELHLRDVLIQGNIDDGQTLQTVLKKDGVPTNPESKSIFLQGLNSSFGKSRYCGLATIIGCGGVFETIDPTPTEANKAMEKINSSNTCLAAECGID